MQYLQLSCVVVDADPGNCRELADFLVRQGAHVLAQLPGIDRLPAVLAAGEPPQLVVVNLDPAPADALRALAPLVRQHAAIAFFTLSQTIDAILLMDAMQVGVKQFLPLPLDQGRFAASLERIAAERGMADNSAHVIHIVPSTGGCGASTIACNVAVTLARAGKTVLVDLDLVRGNVAAAFDLRPRYTIADLMDPAERLDRNLLDNALALHEPSGLSILPRPDRPEDAQRITPLGLNRLLRALPRLFKYVVIDSVMSLDPVYASVIQAAAHNVVVAQLTVPASRNTERYLAALRRAGVPDDHVRVVINRFVKKGWDITPEQFEQAMGTKVAWLVPNDFRNAMSAINFGQPLVLRAPRAEISTSLSELARTLNGR